MKSRLKFIALCCLLSAPCLTVSAQGTAFTYQGRLNNINGPVNGSYDFQFLLYDNSAGGAQQGGTLNVGAVPVTNGLFTVTMDFGAVFSGSPRWLDIFVRTNGAASYSELGQRQNLTPVPYAVYAGNAGIAATSTSFSGSLAGDVTGTQGATVVSTVFGQSAANVATATIAANGASSANVANSIVKRDNSGNFTAGVVTAANFVGGGAGLTGLSASNVTIGTLPVAVLPASVAQLGANQTFTGNNTFGNEVAFSPGNGTLSVINDQGAVPGLVAAGGGAPGHARFRNALEIWPNTALTSSGYLDVRNTSQNATIVLNGQAGSVTAASFSGNGSGLTGVTASTLGGNQLSVISGENGLAVGTNIYLNDKPIYLRSDQNHGLAYNGNGITNFPSAAVQPDGPVLWGYSGGALGVLNGGAQAALTWNNSIVNVASNLTVNGGAAVAYDLSASNIICSGGIITANNTPGVNWIQSDSESVNVPAGQTVGLGSMGDAKPSTGFFLISAYINFQQASGGSSQVFLQLDDVTSGSTLLDEATSNPSSGVGGAGTITITWVVPITQYGGFQNFGLAVANTGTTAITVMGHNMTAMFFPRQNN